VEIARLVNESLDAQRMSTGAAAPGLRQLCRGGPTSRPVALVEQILNSEDPSRLRELNPVAFTEALRFAVSGWLMKSLDIVGPKWIVDTELLRVRWERLPESAKSIFPPHMGQAIEKLAALGSIPMGDAAALAHSLLVENSPLIAALN
jgi:hypothetical protein